MLKLYNTLTRKKETFKPIHKDWVGLYTCGPTVYNYAHIGNLRTYIFEDILRRTLEYAGHKVKHIMNITDVGHLTSDADEGEDKLEKGAKREKKSVWDITKFYTRAFLNDVERLNIKRAHKLVPATREIQEQTKVISRLFEGGYAYETEQAVYFDVTKFKEYTKLSKQKLSQKLVGVREEVVVDPKKRHPADFALWFKIVGRFKNHTMRWPSPWGMGFPGWHIECSAISSKYLGQPFDIHSGGVDHINVHHTNEIAQSEGAYGRPLAKVWMHGEFLLINTSKMAKSGENFLTLNLLIKKGFGPLSYRYLVLTAHYRSKLNFTWESLAAANQSLNRLYDFVRELKNPNLAKADYRGLASIVKSQFERAIFDDLDTPKALAALWQFISDYRKNPGKFNSKEVLGLLYNFDRVLGLGLKNIKLEKIPVEIKKLASKREQTRKSKDWSKADKLRKEIELQGYEIKDTPEGPKIMRRPDR